MDIKQFEEIIKFLLSLNWELIIAIISLIVSCSVLISNKIKSREKYSISVIDYALRHPDILQLLVVITNCSDSPLTIKSIFCHESICELEPKMIRGLPGKFGFVSTPQFPLCIPSHGCQYAYLEFLNYQHTPPTAGASLTLEIHSTLKPERKTVLLGDISHYLHTKEELQFYRDSQQNT